MPLLILASRRSCSASLSRSARASLSSREPSAAAACADITILIATSLASRLLWSSPLLVSRATRRAARAAFSDASFSAAAFSAAAASSATALAVAFRLLSSNCHCCCGGGGCCCGGGGGCCCCGGSIKPSGKLPGTGWPLSSRRRGWPMIMGIEDRTTSQLRTMMILRFWTTLQTNSVSLMTESDWT